MPWLNLKIDEFMGNLIWRRQTDAKEKNIAIITGHLGYY